jgi:hypothetical protein
MTAGKWLFAAALALGLLPRVAAADYWRYTTESGSLAFTDDVKNVPAKYKASAERIPEAKLETYHRLSVVDSATATPRILGPRMISRPEPSADAVAAAPLAPAEPKRDGAIVSLDVGGVKIDVDADSDEPIYVDRQQYSDENGYIDHNGYMAPTTIVRRGDKPLAYIDER